MYSLTMKGLPRLLARVEDADDVGVVAELAHRLGLAAGARLDRLADPLGLEQGDGDLASLLGVVGQVDPLAAALAEEALRTR